MDPLTARGFFQSHFRMTEMLQRIATDFVRLSVSKFSAIPAKVIHIFVNEIHLAICFLISYSYHSLIGNNFQFDR